MFTEKRGQAMIELALVLPILLAIFFLIIDGAFVVQGYLTAKHASREATRFAVTYQPPQGQCYDYNEDGNANNDGWPWCTGNANESDAAYFSRRVEMIKQVAVDAAQGLRISHTCFDATCITDYLEEPGMFGVRVWGFPSFEDSEQEDHPGLPGLPVRVQVTHNVPLVVFAPVIPDAQLQVRGSTDMINEGVQIGYGNRPPPGFAPPGRPAAPGPGDGPGDPTPPPELHPSQLTLNFEQAENQLPDDTSHPVIATVTNIDGEAVNGARVTFMTDAGSFDPGAAVQTKKSNTDANGQAAVQIYSTVPAVASIRAWVDLNSNGALDDDEPSDTATKSWVGGSYAISLNFERATNLLPDERQHAVVANVTTPEGGDVGGAPVTFKLDAGSFEYSGTGMQIEIVQTDTDGDAVTAIYANAPLRAELRAWLDFNQNGVVDGDEPYDTAVKIWEAAGPYLVVTDYNPEQGDTIAIDLRDHLASDNPYELWWCPVGEDTVDITAQIAENLNVETATGDYLGVNFTVPQEAGGTYRIESHLMNGDDDDDDDDEDEDNESVAGCGSQDTLVAYSDQVSIKGVPPDLEITSVTVLNEEAELLNGYPITLSIVVQNNAAAPVIEGPFDLDVYLDLDAAPTSRKLGEAKQWIDTVGAFDTHIVTVAVTSEAFGTHDLWFQVDTSDYIDEGGNGGETNNVFGPLEVVLDCGTYDEVRSNDFDGGLGSWTGGEIDFYPSDQDDGTHYIENGQLHILNRGKGSTGNHDDFYYVFQPYSGEFDARLRIVQGPTSSHNGSQVGLMARESTANSSPFLMASLLPGGQVGSAYRTRPGVGSHSSGGGSAAAPLWVRLVRLDNAYNLYYATTSEPVLSDWQALGSHALDRNLGLIGVANMSGNHQEQSHAIVDDFRMCTDEGGTSQEVHPPGLVECQQLIRVPSFEGNTSTVFNYWGAGPAGGYDRGSSRLLPGGGSFSMRLHASLGEGACSDPSNNLQPYLYQLIEIPTSVYTISTLTVDGHYLSSGSTLPCSYPNRPDADDYLSLELQSSDGSSVLHQSQIVAGAPVSETWQSVTTVIDDVDFTQYAEQTLALTWLGEHDGDFDGTYFYLDEVSAELCTSWPIPESQPGKATFGGNVRTLNEYQTAVLLPGADVWAYAQDGQVHHTRSIHDGSYHFYNLEPGTYIIYSEAMVAGTTRYATVSVSLEANESDDTIYLFLQ